MQKISTTLLSILALCAFGLVLSSCKDDDGEPAKPQLSFSTSSLTLSEDDGPLEIEVELDKPAPEDLVIEYELSGTAYDDIRADQEEVGADFEIIDGEYGEIEIAKGETTGTITIQPYADFNFEGTETIVIRLKEADSEKIEITRDDDITIEFEQELNGLIVSLSWPGPGEETVGVADMDMFLWIGEDVSSLETIVAGSFGTSYEPGEIIFIPKSITNVAYGLSYNYYWGNLDPLEFSVDFIEIEDGDDVSTTTFSGTYTAVNEHLWDEEDDVFYTTQVVQTFVNDGGDFEDFSEISTPEEGSRAAQVRIPLPTRFKKK